jgi:hypothetical protein
MRERLVLEKRWKNLAFKSREKGRAERLRPGA